MIDLGSIAVAEPVLEGLTPTNRDWNVLPTAELAECTCPEFCERDHDTD